MLDRLTPAARRAVVHAQSEARRVGGEAIGAEHLLAGLLLVDGSPAARALAAFGVTIVHIRSHLGATVNGPSEAQHFPFDAAAKEILEASIRESESRNQSAASTLHVLLSLVLTTNRGSSLLANLGVTPANLAPDIERMLADFNSLLLVEDADSTPVAREVKAEQQLEVGIPALNLPELFDHITHLEETLHRIEARLKEIERRIGLSPD